MNIIENQNEITASQKGTYYVKKENIRISINVNSISVIDLTNAMQSGKQCKRVSIHDKYNSDICAKINFMATINNDFKSLLTYTNQEFDHIDVYTANNDSIRTFSPFAVDKVKPLKEMPKKWTMKHVYKAILNNQYMGLTCNGIYTDDYAYDYSCNYRQGEILKAMDWIKDIIEHPSGWWCSMSNNVVHVCCHSFDSNEFTPVIK